MAASAQCLASYSISTLARHSLPLVPPLFLTLYHYLTLFPLLFDSDIYFIQIPMSFRYLYYADMGWLWLVGSMKLQVSFAKEPYKRDYILQKRPIILSILLTVATPYLYYSDIYIMQIQPIAYGGTFLQSQISVDVRVLQVSFATFR